MPLTDAEKQKVAYHLGYLGTSQGFSINLGIPAANQPMFIVFTALENIITLADADMYVSRIRQIIGIMDNIETKMIAAQDRLSAKTAGEVELNPHETDKLEGEYVRWGYRLADVLGAPPNPYSLRYQVGMSGGNITVVQ